MIEEWKEIPRCGGFIASSLGRIRNLKTGKIFTGYVDKKGYTRVSVIEGGVRKNRNVARLVARAFIDGDERLMVLHKNGKPSDNRPENLKYGTAKDNYADAIKHGTNCRGDRYGNAKLTPDQARAIKKEHATGEITYTDLGKKYGVEETTVYRLVSGENWAWLNKDDLSDEN